MFLSRFFFSDAPKSGFRGTVSGLLGRLLLVCSLVALLHPAVPLASPTNAEAAAPQVEYTPGQLLVKLKPGLHFLSEAGEVASGSVALTSLLRRYGVTSVDPVDSVASTYLLHVSPETLIPEAVASFARLGEVEFAEPDYHLQAALIPNDPYFRTALDGCHALALRYLEAPDGNAGIGSARSLAMQQRWVAETPVARLMEALVHAAPEALRREGGKDSAAARFPEFRAWHALLWPLFGIQPPDWSAKPPPQASFLHMVDNGPEETDEIEDEEDEE